MRNEGKNHFFERTYRVEYKKAFGAQDIIVTEDAGPGCRIFREFFENITVCSAETKSNVSKTVKNLPPDCKNVLVVYDAAAFGMQIKKFREMMANEHRNISVLDWYSFEHHVLSGPPFYRWIDPDSLDYTHESLEQHAAEVLASAVRYSKSKGMFSPCLSKRGRCGSCDRISGCRYVHDSFELGISIARASAASE